MRLALLLLGLLVSAPRAEASSSPVEQFDLVCTGTMNSLNQVGEQSVKPWTLRLSVDLARSAFRRGQSAIIEPINRITPGEIIFTDDLKAYHGAGSVEDHFYVFRTNGAAFFSHRESGVIEARDDLSGGKCTLADFTPFPALMF